MAQSEKREILALARMMGVSEPVKVSLEVYGPRGQSFVVVDGRVSDAGQHPTWLRARMFREGWYRSQDQPVPEPHAQRVGHWIALGDAREQQLWRIHDGPWFLDVTPNAAVALEDAEQIVLALRRKTYQSTAVDDSAAGLVLSGFGAETPAVIARHSDGSFSLEWSPSDGGGRRVTVTLAQGRVTLLSAYIFEL